MAEKHTRRSALVTGGSGFIGSFLVEKLLDDGFSVRVPSRSGNRGFLKHIQDDIEWFEGDIRDKDFCKALCEGMDIIFHLASHRKNITYHRGEHAQEIYEDNLAMTRALIEGISGSDVVFFSTVSAGQVDPETRLIGDVFDGYIAAKAACERAWEDASAQSGFPLLIVRPVHVYGPRDTFSEDSNVIPALIVRASKAKDHLTVWGSGKQERSFIYVEDLVAAVMTLVGQKVQGTTCVHPPEMTSISTLAEAIRDLLSPELVIDFDTSKPEGSPLDLPPIHPTLQSLKWTALKDGLEKTVRHYLSSR